MLPGVKKFLILSFRDATSTLLPNYFPPTIPTKASLYILSVAFYHIVFIFRHLRIKLCSGVGKKPILICSLAGKAAQHAVVLPGAELTARTPG